MLVDYGPVEDITHRVFKKRGLDDGITLVDDCMTIGYASCANC